MTVFFVRRFGHIPFGCIVSTEVKLSKRYADIGENRCFYRPVPAC